MRYILIFAVCGMMVLGCGHGAPVVPDETCPQDLSACQSGTNDEGPYRLWGEWDLYISADHERVEAVPKRTARFHLNALKFLEETCRDCLQILSVRNNYDGTIDLTIRITHPFNGFPQYTGFDVKGIIMFDGSYEYPIPSLDTRIPVDGDFFRVSWKEYGDPEILNPDGYTFRWNPEWDEGSSRPILNYWPGRWSNGTPTAHINAFLNFYSHEERHMFAHDRSVTRTYHIWLPPEPIVAGYAVEACWEPPTVTPVTDPLTDFPVTANQPEPYLFEVIINDGMPVTQCDGCCIGFIPLQCDISRFHFKEWTENEWGEILLYRVPPLDGGEGYPEQIWMPCSEYESWHTGAGIASICSYGNGIHRFLFLMCRHGFNDNEPLDTWMFADVITNDPNLD